MKLLLFVKRSAGVALTLGLLGSPLPLRAIDTQDTRLLADPAIHGDQLAFAYANDLWTARVDGSDVRRLTSHPGVESGPHFSPDGRLVEAVEVPGKRFYVGVQYHPEFKSRPNRAHPLFRAFVADALRYQDEDK